MRKRSRGGEKTFIHFSRWGSVFRGEQFTFIWRWRGRGVGFSFLFFGYFCTFVKILLFFLTFEGGRRHGSFPLFFCSFLKGGKGAWVFFIFFYSWIGEVAVSFTFLSFVIFFNSWRGGRGAWVFFKNKILHLKGGGGCGFIYLLFFVNFIIINILLSHFLTPKGGGWHGFYFSSYFYFFYCVLSFCYHFLLLPGEGGVVFLFFLIIILYIFNKCFGTFFTFLRAEGGTSFLKTC